MSNLGLLILSFFVVIILLYYVVVFFGTRKIKDEEIIDDNIDSVNNSTFLVKCKNGSYYSKGLNRMGGFALKVRVVQEGEEMRLFYEYFPQVCELFFGKYPCFIRGDDSFSIEENIFNDLVMKREVSGKMNSIEFSELTDFSREKLLDWRFKKNAEVDYENR